MESKTRNHGRHDEFKTFLVKIAGSKAVLQGSCEAQKNPTLRIYAQINDVLPEHRKKSEQRCHGFVFYNGFK